MSTAILLLAHGGPESLAELPAFLADVRHGRPTPPALLAEVTRRYTLIGGRSPLLDITRRTATALERALGLPVYFGMRHWHPYIRTTVRAMATAGVSHLLAICLAPQYSRLSTGAYEDELAAALRDLPLTASFVTHWHLQPEFLDGVAANVRTTLERFDPADRGAVRILFTGHSLPASLLAQGDPYDAQLRETAAAVAARLGLNPGRWQFCYQSAPQVDIPWLGPQIESLVPELARAGASRLLVAPVGFVADHVEVLYDLDIGLQQIARACGVRVERTPMLNDGPALIAALSALARARLEEHYA